MTTTAELAFADIIGEEDRTALLLDHRGRVRAGLYLDSSGADVSVEIARAMSGVGAEATRAMRHLPLGEWKAIICECDQATMGLSPADDGDIVLVATPPDVPPGFVRRFLSSASRHALAWRRRQVA